VSSSIHDLKIPGKIKYCCWTKRGLILLLLVAMTTLRVEEDNMDLQSWHPELIAQQKWFTKRFFLF